MKGLDTDEVICVSQRLVLHWGRHVRGLTESG